MGSDVIFWSYRFWDLSPDPQDTSVKWRLGGWDSNVMLPKLPGRLFDCFDCETVYPVHVCASLKATRLLTHRARRAGGGGASSRELFLGAHRKSCVAATLPSVHVAEIIGQKNRTTGTTQGAGCWFAESVKQDDLAEVPPRSPWSIWVVMSIRILVGRAPIQHIAYLDIGFKILGEKYHLLPFFVGETFEDNIIVENNRINPTMTIWTKMTQKSHEQTLKKKHCSKNISEKWRWRIL